MLTKLLKHEWKGCWKVPTVLIGILWITAVFAGLTFLSPMWRIGMEGMDVLLILVIMAFYFMIIAVSVGITLYMAIRFYRSMFTDEGYLTHTLPVTTHQLLLSKILPMAAWNFLATLGIIVSLLIFGGLACFFMSADWQTAMDAFKRGWLQINEMFGNSLPGFAVSTAAMMLVGVFSGSMMIAGSVSLGQMVTKHKVLGSIGAYFAINTVTQIMMTVIMMPTMFRMSNIQDNDVFRLLTSIYWIVSIIMAVVTVGLYFLSEYLIRRKLNLD